MIFWHESCIIESFMVFIWQRTRETENSKVMKRDIKFYGYVSRLQRFPVAETNPRETRGVCALSSDFQPTFLSVRTQKQGIHTRYFPKLLFFN